MIYYWHVYPSRACFVAADFPYIRTAPSNTLYFMLTASPPDKANARPDI